MKRFIDILLCFTLLLSTASCILEYPDLDCEAGDVSISLALVPGDVSAGHFAKLSQTKATSSYGEDRWNENLIDKFRLYFYTASANDDASAVYVWPQTGWASIDNLPATVGGTDALVADPIKGKVDVKFTLSRKLADELFPFNASQCRVYAVANIDGLGLLPEGLPSVNQLKHIVLTSEFGPTGSADPFSVAPPYFAMSGEGILHKNNTARTISGGDIAMLRSASKISLYLTKVNNDDVDDKTWVPDTENMRVEYIHGVNKGCLDAHLSAAERRAASFSYIGKARLLTPYSVGGVSTGWMNEMPFWSYHHDWSTFEEGDAPYLLLTVPWRQMDEGGLSVKRYFTCYYAVPFNSVNKSLERNAWYRVRLSVSILGSGDPDNPTEIVPSYMILPWGRETVRTDAELLRYRYLMADQNSYVMHNVNSLTMTFFTSHPIRISSRKLTKMNLSPTTGFEPVEVAVSTSEYTLVPDNEKGSVTFTHILKNNYSTNDYDVAPYKLTFTIEHADDPSYMETITVVQNPALFVEAALNSDCKNPDGGTSGSGNHSNKGYVFVNNSNSGSGWYSVSYNGGNKDPYMYVVNIGSLPPDSEYIIGDPRVEQTTDLSEFNTTNWWNGSISYWAETAGDLNGVRRRLAYYLPSDENGERVNNMIAPSFRIASSYGVVNQLTYNDAKKRCAAYQEDGFPAGRWRIPTRAEIKYMVLLAKDGKIPVLLSDDAYYWGSDKKAYSPGNFNNPHTNPSSTSNNYVRCVYDEWYWTDKCNKSTFTWGDRPR